MVVIKEEDYISHYGTPRLSGRYPWGSGGNEVGSTKRNQDWVSYVKELKSQGMSDKEIYEGMGMTSTEFRVRNSIEVNAQKQARISQAQRLADTGMSNTAIGKEMGIPESTVRSYLKPGAKDKADKLTNTANLLRDQVNEKRMVDVGVGTENYIGVSQDRMRTALKILQDEGYNVHQVPVPQIGTGKNTNMKVLTLPDITQRDAFMNKSDIKLINEWSEDGGKTSIRIQEPLSIKANRIGVVYGEKGATKDGVMYVRPGVEDLSLGNSNYAQVRVLVGKDRYLKGMAMYHDGLPEGTDILFHTNKDDTGNKLDALKKVDPKTATPNNPFGANISRQITVETSPGKHKVTSTMNIVNDEASWDKWSDDISAQMLSKQSPSLAKTQLDHTFENHQFELKEINSLTNPTVKKDLLMKFADSTDASAVHLEAAAFPRQSWHAILPIDTMPPGQIYAPNFREGERVALIRYPHGGTFEIPELTVNNSNAQAKKLIGNEAKFAVGINHEVAKRLSGADFDGDTVLVIPNNNRQIKGTPALDGLKDFDPIRSYPGYEGMQVMTPKRTQQEMGKISNLITDMTIQGAPTTDLVRAVRHSMVVIDAEKHGLNFKESERVNGIAQLKKEYQGKSNGGAATLLSRAASETHPLDRRPARISEGGAINPLTGEKNFVPTNRMRTTRSGEKVLATIKSTKLAETSDAHTLTSVKNTQMERLYADHSNRLKALANQARLDAINTPRLKRSPSAARVYSKEVASLDAKLDVAQKGKPLERQAQLLAGSMYQARVNANPEMPNETKKKVKYQCLAEARIRTGAEKNRIEFTDSEWSAIQAGAISDSKLGEILKNAKVDSVRAMAMPKPKLLMTPAKTKRAQDMLALGYTRSEVADHLGVSLTTLDVATVG